MHISKIQSPIGKRAFRYHLQKPRTRGIQGPLGGSQTTLYPHQQPGRNPKKHSDKWRLILDLSHPLGYSVNDGIDRKICSLSYMRVDDVVQEVLSRRRGCQLAKIDIESAFRNVPVHPHDRHLLGLSWEDKLFIDTALPFGLRSAPQKSLTDYKPNTYDVIIN